MKKVILFISLAAGWLFAQTNETPKTIPIDGYAARVDNTIITYGEVRENALPFLQQLARRFQGDELAKRIAQTYIDSRETMIDEALLKAEAKTLGLALPDHVIDDEVNRLIRERFDNDRTQLTRALTTRRMTFDEWRQEVADQLTVRVFYNQEVTRRATVSATDVRKYYDDHQKEFFIPFKVKYRFILINKGKTDEDRAVKKQQVEDTLKKLRDGADFNTVAKEVSEGDTDEVPWRELQDIRPEFHTALKETPAGGISSIIETRDEYYIVKVEERREEGYTPFEDVREPIENRLMQAERDRLHKELIERLTAKHFIERY